jgi:hypothetical protein
MLICSVWFGFFDLGGDDAKSTDTVCEEGKDDTELSMKSCENSVVFSSLPLAIKWVRDSVKQNQSIRFQVKSYLIGECCIFDVILPVEHIHMENIFHHWKIWSK